MANLHESVFTKIVTRWQSRADDIACFTKARYSFEEWLNWEAFAACCAEPTWTTSPRPSYRKVGSPECRDYGDLLVANGADQVLVEVGLVHDGTGDKWRAKLAWDVEKLARPLTHGVAPLQMVALVSAVDIEQSDAWQRWLKKVDCWGRDTDLHASVRLPPSGQMIVRGWATSAAAPANR